MITFQKKRTNRGTSITFRNVSLPWIPVLAILRKSHNRDPQTMGFSFLFLKKFSTGWKEPDQVLKTLDSLILIPPFQ